jgi:hypothetical protein
MNSSCATPETQSQAANFEEQPVGLEDSLICLRKENNLLRENFKSKEDECREEHKLVEDMGHEQEKLQRRL